MLDLEGVDFVDSQGAAKLAEILEFAESAGVELRLARIKPAVAAVLEKDGVLGASAETTSTATSTGPSRHRSPRTHWDRQTLSWVRQLMSNAALG